MTHPFLSTGKKTKPDWAKRDRVKTSKSIIRSIAKAKGRKK
jgi:hypothetical protein